jgi:type I restriction-modification system DNA methylase subunit
MAIDFQRSRDFLSDFDFHNLFIEELGWSRPSSNRAESVMVEEVTYQRQRIAEMADVPVFEVTAPDGEIPLGEARLKVYKAIAESFAENLLIFVNGDRTRSLWYWAKREGSKVYPRIDWYIKGQPIDLLLSKIGGLKIELDELGPEGELPVVEVADRLQKSLDVEKVTKKFYQAFQLEHQEFLDYVQGIDNEGDRRWYTSVILNRLMFVYFLQKKGFINGGDLKYLREKLTESQRRGPDQFYNEFLDALFFEGLARPERDRSSAVQQMLGQVRYLNGGLFLKHAIELNERYDIHIPDEAFDRIFALFENYSWNLDDRPGGKPDEINPDVLGYIFEKYINQKAFGAYYTRPEITEYLCDRTINKLILDRVNAAVAQQNRQPHEIQAFESIEDMAMHMDEEICRHLVMGDDAILRNLSLLDPACGSGAFLIAAMKTLIKIYSSVIGTVTTSTDRQLRNWLKQVTDDHPSVSYFIKKRIITDNLYGVDIMEEAVEIAKLRLFLTLVSSAMSVAELEPLPNIDFNIMAGNSLIGLMRVDEASFDAVGDSGFQQGNLLQLDAANSYRQILEEKNHNIELYKKHAFQPDSQRDPDHRPQVGAILELRNQIDKLNRESQAKLNQILLSEFSGKLGIKFEQAQLTGRPKKRLLTIADIEALKPFHWGYHFDKVIEKRGGFDAIIANPPWEIFKPNAREFFFQHNELVIKSKMDIKQFQKAQKKLLQDSEIAAAWVEYQSQYPHISAYYRSAEQYKNQIAIVNGRKAGTDINLYKLFLEQCFNLLKPGGDCGIIIPTGIYTDLGTKQLREMLFSQCRIDALYGISNERFIFDGVDHRFKFSLLTFDKGGQTDAFTAAFRIDPREAISKERIGYFLSSAEEHIQIEVPLIRQLSPDSLSVMEFKNELDIQIAKKMSQFPLLGKKIDGKWNLKLTAEFHMTNDSKLFKPEAAGGRLPLYEGKMIHQFSHQLAEPRYWIDESAGRKSILKRGEVDTGQKLAYQDYRLGLRAIARNTDIRTLISTVIPKKAFCGNSVLVSANSDFSGLEVIFTASILSSFVLDFYIRQKVAANINMFYVYQIPMPRLVEGDLYFSDIVNRAAKLICTTPDFDDLAAEVGLVPSPPTPLERLLPLLPREKGVGGMRAPMASPTPPTAHSSAPNSTV